MVPLEWGKGGFPIDSLSQTFEMERPLEKSISLKGELRT